MSISTANPYALAVATVWRMDIVALLRTAWFTAPGTLAFVWCIFYAAHRALRMHEGFCVASRLRIMGFWLGGFF